MFIGYVQLVSKLILFAQLQTNVMYKIDAVVNLLSQYPALAPTQGNEVDAWNGNEAVKFPWVDRQKKTSCLWLTLVFRWIWDRTSCAEHPSNDVDSQGCS